MTLLCSTLAAVITTVVRYLCPQRDSMRLGTLSLMYWGASLMWLVDAVTEYLQEGAAYFQQSFSEILNDSLLGLSAVTLGAIAWLAILLVKDPKRVFKQQ